MTPERCRSEHFVIFDTVLGACALLWTDDGTSGVHLPEPSAELLRSRVEQEHPGAIEYRGARSADAGGPSYLSSLPTAIEDAVTRMTALLAGRTRDDLADIELDMTGISPMLRRIYGLVRTIAPGRTRTYGEVAAELGNPGLARAVGRAMGANPFPIIVPCHRVTAADGAIGGFSAPGGAATKRRMLLVEGVPERDGPALFGADEMYASGDMYAGRGDPI